VRERGVVRRQTIAVLIDDVHAVGEDGTPVYTARSEQEMEQLRALVERTVGFDPGRGDEIEMVNMSFDRADQFDIQDGPILLGLSKPELFRIIEIGVLGLVALLTILLVVRPLVGRLLDGEDEIESDSEVQLNKLLTDQSNGLQRALAGPGGEEEGVEGGSADAGALIDVNQVEGQVRASAIRKVGEIVEQHPEESVQVLRIWLTQDA